ncbi:MAG: hypothetical protein Q9159_004587 [Coniocarpon cinnabarinum]
MASPNDPRDPNPFVAFRRYADTQFAHMFNSLADPFRQGFPRDDAQWRQAQEDLWRKFERSYERSTNPNRTQTERDTYSQPSPADTKKDADGLPSFGREIEDPLQPTDGPFAPEHVHRREMKKRNANILGKLLTALGKTTLEEESIRLLGQQLQRDELEERERAEEIGRRMDRCPGVQAMYREAEEQEQREEIGRRMDPCPGVQAMYAEAEENERAEEIGRRMDKCPGVQQMYAEQEATDEANRRIDRCPWVQQQERQQGNQQDDERTTPYGMSWSWGPWGCEMGSRRTRLSSSDDDKDAPDVRVEEHTFGPWTIGPIHVGPMSMSTSFPRDYQAEVQKHLEEIEKRRDEYFGRMMQMDPRPRATRSSSSGEANTDTDNDSRYAPTELMKRDGFRGHLNWRQAFEDLMAVETGDVMLGGTPWSATETESDESWRARLTDRGLYSASDAWQRRMVGLHQASSETDQSVQRTQEGPHSELELYDAMTQRQSSAFPHEEERQMHPAKPSILSTVTSVETVQNPDGSTTTKRSTKRRFADGRVEKEEEREETPAVRTPQSPSVRRLGEQEEKRAPRIAERAEKQGKEKGSWFWS